jgi:hypothetical protein
MLIDDMSVICGSDVLCVRMTAICSVWNRTPPHNKIHYYYYYYYYYYY